MINTGKLAGKVVFITGASRGIGKSIALKLAKDGCNIAIASKTSEPHAKLEGTIHTVAKEVENVGGKCLPLQVDIRYEDQIKNAIDQTAQKFGGLDILINNASAINLTSTQDTEMKRYDLMHGVNVRGTFMTSKYAIKYLLNSTHAHILNLSPPLVMNSIWFKNHVAYSMSKYGMSMCVLGMAEEFKNKIAVNALWPKTAIWTAALNMLAGEDGKKGCRKPDILADAAYAILSKAPTETTGNFFIDEDVVKREGITDLNQYAMVPGEKLLADFFLPEEYLSDESLEFQLLNASPSSTQELSPAAKIFKNVSKVMTDTIKNEINAVLLFNISDKNWFVDAHSSRPFQITQESNNKPDVTLITDENTFYKMAKGEIKPTNAFMAGKLKVKGNLAVAMKAEKLFSKLKTSI